MLTPMIMYQVILFISVAWFIETECFLIKPWKQCIPTTIVEGTCHTCVCAVDGIFYCRPEQCRDEDIKTDSIDRKECDPNLTYRDGETFCMCDPTGHWRSMNCKDRFHRVHSKTALLRHMLRTNIACKPNATYLIDCNVCQCGSSGLLESTSCTHRLCVEGHKADNCNAGEVLRVGNEFCVCSDINSYIDNLCIKLTDDVIQELDNVKLSKILNVGRTSVQSDESNNGCEPNKTYTIDCNTCFCTLNRYLGCTLKVCMRNNVKADLRSKLRVDAFDSLPELKSEDERCKPGNTYRLKCNTCVCAADGHPTCSTMLCLDDFKWDLKPLNNVSHRLKTWNDLPAIHEGETCVPGYQYRSNCNKCYCKEDGALMCSKMACLNTESLPNKSKKPKKIKKLKNITDKTALRADLSKYPILPDGACSPGNVYKDGCQRCICGENKKAVCTKTKNACKVHAESTLIRYLEDIHPRVTPKDIAVLPTLPNRQVVCKPGRLYRVECNACVCLNNKNLVCDQMTCLSFDEMHRIKADQLTGENCKYNTKFEKDCVKCLCLNGKQDCLEIEGCITEEDKKQPIWKDGTPHVFLDINKDKCIPGAVYRINCNNCYCQRDDTLRCTQKTCLNYSQARAMEKQRKHLLARGL